MTRRLTALLVGVGVVLIATPAIAAETSNAEFVIIPTDDVIEDDLYAGAVRVIVDGTLDGDLIAFAAEEVVINGVVTGSVTAVTPQVVVNGEVGDSVRASGNRLEVNGTVGSDVVAAVVSAEFGADSDVAGDVLVWAWNLTALGTIGQDLSGTQRNLELAGTVDGDVEVSVGQLDVVGDLTVGGDLGYRSANDADGLDQVAAGGTVVDKEPLPPNIRVRALSLLGRFLVVLFLSIAALTAAYGWPDRTTRAVAQVGQGMLWRWLSGAVIVFAPFLAVVLTGLIVGLAPAAAAFPLLLVLVPVILALFGLAFAVALVAGAPVVGWLGGVLFKRLDLYGAILAGSVLVGVVWYLPWVGWLVPLVVLPLGLGAWLATWRQEDVAASSPV